VTTATTWRKERGRQTERLVAEFLRLTGIAPHAEPVGASRPGDDITGAPGLHIEVKATKACTPRAWLRQITARGGDGIAFAVWRPDGMGGASIAQWPVIIELGEFADLLIDAREGDRE
jgi:hypothetical protein